jgi:hypothetical protein
MKKLVIIVAIVAICVSFSGCVSPVASYKVEAQTMSEVGDIKASDYRTDDFYKNDYFIVILLTTSNTSTIALLDESTNTFNFMLLMSDGKNVLKAIRPIKELFGVRENSEDNKTEYALVFYSNYTLDEYDYTLCIKQEDGDYKNVKVREAKEGD